MIGNNNIPITTTSFQHFQFAMDILASDGNLMDMPEEAKLEEGAFNTKCSCHYAGGSAALRHKLVARAAAEQSQPKVVGTSLNLIIAMPRL